MEINTIESQLNSCIFLLFTKWDSKKIWFLFCVFSVFDCYIKITQMIRFFSFFPLFFSNQAAHLLFWQVCLSLPSLFFRASVVVVRNLVLIVLLVLQIVPVSVVSMFRRSGLKCTFVSPAFNAGSFMVVFNLWIYFTKYACVRRSINIYFCSGLFLFARSIWRLPPVFMRSILCILCNSCSQSVSNLIRSTCGWMEM